MAGLVFTLLDAVSDGQGAVNEDAWGIGTDRLFVVDGATGVADEALTPGATDASWLSREAVGILEAGVPGETVDGVFVGLAYALTARFAAISSRPAAGIAPGAFPIAAMGLGLLAGGELRIGAISDVTTVVAGADGVVAAVSDDAIAPYTARTLATLARAKASGDLDPWPIVRAEVRVNRDAVNQPGGYWAVHPALPWAHGGARRVVPVVAGCHVLMMSDGFSRLVDLFGAYDWAGLLAAAKARGLPALLAELREREEADADAARFPRVKRHDDATAVLAVIAEG